jgi:hypothetical protein
MPFGFGHSQKKVWNQTFEHLVAVNRNSIRSGNYEQSLAKDHLTRKMLE